MTENRPKLTLLALLGALLTAPAPPATPPTLDLSLGSRLRVPLDDLAGRVPLAPDRNFRVEEIGRDTGSSHHVVAIRTAEIPHRHDHHDLFVVVLRGYGTWRVGDTTETVGEQSLLYVPRGTLHAFTNEADEPAVAYAVYVPPFDGDDRIEVPE